MVFIGYVWVLMVEQDIVLQMDVLCKVGCECVFEDMVFGVKVDRFGLVVVLVYLCDGDVLVVWWLDWFGCLMLYFIEIIGVLEVCGVGFWLLIESIDIIILGGWFIFYVFGVLGQFECDLICECIKVGLIVVVVCGCKGGCKLVVIVDKLQWVQEYIVNGLNVWEVVIWFKVSKMVLYVVL